MRRIYVKRHANKSILHLFIDKAINSVRRAYRKTFCLLRRNMDEKSVKLHPE